MKAVAGVVAFVAATSVFAQPAALQLTDARACEIAREGSARGEAVMQATYANCLVMGAVREPKALPHARELARASMKQGNEIGAFALYAAFAIDPAFSFMSNGKPDMAKYSAIAALPLQARGLQTEAIEALAFAASKDYPKAMLALAAYYYETVAPKNVLRLRNLAARMQAKGVDSPYVEQFRKQADEVAAVGDTKASVRAFHDAETPAKFTAHALLAQGGAPCELLRLAKVESGELRGAVFLPLKSPDLRDTYVVKGEWDETWRFEGCGREARVRVHFGADGWGGATVQTMIAAGKP